MSDEAFYLNHHDPGVRNLLRRIIAERDAAQRVARELVDFHNDYKRNTLGCDMPGNDLYSGLLMDIVRHARESLNGGTHEQN